MTVAIVILLSFIALNTFFILATILCLYGKFNDIIESKERQSEAINKIIDRVVKSIDNKAKQ